MAVKKIRFRNKADGLRVIYDENGGKKELVPNATIFLEPDWGNRFKCLERVINPKAGPGRPPKENKEEWGIKIDYWGVSCWNSDKIG